jgi:hypothetical protein
MDIYYIPPLPLDSGGRGSITVCAVSNFIYTGRISLEGEGDLFF